MLIYRQVEIRQRDDAPTEVLHRTIRLAELQSCGVERSVAVVFPMKR